VSARERILEFVAVLLLSIATVCIAWSGYQAAKWSGHQARHYAQASTARALANRAATLGGQERIQGPPELQPLARVSTDGNTSLAQLYERRFRPEFRPAFRAWLAQDPINNTAAIASPLLYAQYKVANFEKADALERLGNRGSTRRERPPSTPTHTSSPRSSSRRCCSSPESRLRLQLDR